jgi:hypothetical protein
MVLFLRGRATQSPADIATTNARICPVLFTTRFSGASGVSHDAFQGTYSAFDELRRLAFELAGYGDLGRIDGYVEDEDDEGDPIDPPEGSRTSGTLCRSPTGSTHCSPKNPTATAVSPTWPKGCSAIVRMAPSGPFASAGSKVAAAYTSNSPHDGEGDALGCIAHPAH